MIRMIAMECENGKVTEKMKLEELLQAMLIQQAHTSYIRYTPCLLYTKCIYLDNKDLIMCNRKECNLTQEEYTFIREVRSSNSLMPHHI